MPEHSRDPYSPERVKEDLYRRFSRRGLWRLRLRRLVGGLSWLFFVQLLAGIKRVFDLLLAGLLLLLLAPLLLAIVVLFRAQGIGLQRVPRVGRWCETFYEYTLVTPDNRFGHLLQTLGINRLPALWNILQGDLSFVGPRAVSPGELSPRERAVRKRYNVRPGLICLWWIRRRVNIAYGSEVEADSEYVDTQSVWGDLGIALRSIPAVIYGEGVATAPDLLTVLGIPLHNLTMAEAVETIMAHLQGDRSGQVCFVNAHCVNIAYRDPEYHRVLRSAWLTLADGIGLKLAGQLLARHIKQNVNGSDLFPRLCEALAGSGKGVFLLGARPDVVAAVRDWIATHYPEVVVAGYHHGYFAAAEEQQVIDQIARSGAALLLVALGVPYQDKWISRHLAKTGVKVALGVGGLFDFYSGRIPRAPQWIRETGLEWLYRFWQEPGRMWKRYFVGNALFLLRVLKERLRASAVF